MRDPGGKLNACTTPRVDDRVEAAAANAGERAMERIQRELATGNRRAFEFGLCEQLFGFTVGTLEVLWRNLVNRRKPSVDSLREAEVAGLGRHLETRPDIAVVQRRLFDQCVEQRVARRGRLAAGEPQRLRFRQRLCALRRQPLLQRVAKKLGVLVQRQRMFLCEQVPCAAAAKRL